MSYTVKFEDQSVIINTDNFDPVQTFECGQAFRWSLNDGVYTGIAFDRILYLKWSGNCIQIWPCSEYEFESIWRDYFDLERDYNEIIEYFRCDNILYETAKFGSGIRILKQDLWETLISFIISQNNSIHRIKGIINKICRKWGLKIISLGNEYYSFPTPEQLEKATIAELMQCGAGYRADSILKAAEKVADGYPLKDLYDMPIEDIRKELISFKGIGPKVADCIILYSLGRMDAFPVDTWIKKAMETMYIGKACNQKTIMQEADKLFGGYAGLAQQYLFYYSRVNKIEGISDHNKNSN